MKNLRGSSALWASNLEELLPMMKQLGMPSFFLTFSCNDLHWEDMKKALLIADDRPHENPNNLSLEDVQKLIEKHPVTVSRQFIVGVEALLRLLKNAETLFGGKVVDYWYRIEFQNRGSPHLHMVIWNENLPDFNTDEGVKLLESLISCRKPDSSEDSELHKLVTECQEHIDTRLHAAKKVMFVVLDFYGLFPQKQNLLKEISKHYGKMEDECSF